MPEIIVILDNIRSSYNVGSIARTSDGFGVTAIYTLGITPHMKQPKDTRLPHVIARAEKEISKTALGGETLLTKHFDTYEQILSELTDHQIAAVEQSDSSIPLSSYVPSSNVAIVLGNEVDGVSQALQEASDHTLEIEMFGDKESFNVASSAAIVLYEVRSKFAKM